MSNPLPPTKKSIWRILAPLAIVAIVIPLLGFLQSFVDTKRDLSTKQEMLYFPNDKLLRHFTAGLSSIVADFMWYETAQYVGAEFQNSTVKGSWLSQLVCTTTKLAPHHEDAFRYGGSLLAAIGSDDLGMEILQEGFVNNPDSWAIPFEMHSIYLMNRREWKDANLLASRYAYLVAERQTPEYQAMYFELANKLLNKENMHAEAVEFFREKAARETDPMLRSMAEYQYRVAVIELNLDVLNKAADAYAEQAGEYPASLLTLADAGLVNALPSDPADGDYYIDARDKRVRKMTIQTERKQRYLQNMNRWAQRFSKEQGRNPESLDELWTWSKRRPYPYPLPTGDWEYNAETGIVQ